MIFPTIKVVRKTREEIEKSSRVMAYEKFQYNARMNNDSKGSLNEPKPFPSPLRSYRPYSKLKLVSESRKSPSPKPNLHPITVPELAITPEYLSMIKYFSEKLNQNLKIPLCGLTKGPTKLKVKSIPQKVNQTVFCRALQNSSRKVVLSRTPDPWKQFESVTKAEIEDSDSENCLSNTYDY